MYVPYLERAPYVCQILAFDVRNKKKVSFFTVRKKKSDLRSTHCKLSQTYFATSASRIGLRSSARGMYPIVSLRRKKNGCFRLHYTPTAAAAAEEEKEEGQEQQQQAASS